MTLPPNSRYATQRKRRRNPESGAQSAILKFANLHRDVAWARRMNSGAGYILPAPPRVLLQLSDALLRQQVRTAKWIEWGFVGCSDILGQMRDGRLLALEVKTSNGKLTTEQAMFLELVIRANGRGGMVRSLEDAVGVIEG